MIVTLFTAMSGLRFLHSVVMGILVVLLGIVSEAILGEVEINTIY